MHKYRIHDSLQLNNNLTNRQIHIQTYICNTTQIIQQIQEHNGNEWLA